MTKYQESLFKENLEAMYFSLSERILGYKPVKIADVNYIHLRSEEPPPHFIKIVKSPHSKAFKVLQIQIVDKDVADMQYGMLVYYAQLFSKFEMEIEQIVLYLGEGPSKMIDYLKNMQNSFHYNLFSIQSLSCKTYLESDKAHELSLAILADLENESSASVIEKILIKAKELTNDFFSFDKFAAQLEKFAALRNYNDAYNNVIDQLMLLDTKIQDSYIFKKGVETAKKEMITTLIKKGQMSSEEIAEVAGVSSEFVKEVANEIENGQD